MAEQNRNVAPDKTPSGGSLRDTPAGQSRDEHASDPDLGREANLTLTHGSAERNPLDERYTGGGYLAENPEWGERNASWKAEQVAAMLRKHQLQPRTICDIGCGTGGVLDALRAFLPNTSSLTGYEAASQALELAPADRRRRIELINARHDADDRRFDLLLALDVFEHVEDYYGFLRDIRSKASLAIFHIPIDTAVTSVLRPGPVLRSYRKVGHIQHYTPTLALEALRHVGYTILDYHHTIPARVAAPDSVRGWVGKIGRLSLARLNVNLAAKLVPGFPLLVLAETGTNS